MDNLANIPIEKGEKLLEFELCGLVDICEYLAGKGGTEFEFE